MGTNFVRCENGHLYNAAEHMKCPYCAQADSSHTQYMVNTDEDENVTVRSTESDGSDVKRFEDAGYAAGPSEDRTVKYTEDPGPSRTSREGMTVKLSEAGVDRGRIDPVAVAMSVPSGFYQPGQPSAGAYQPGPAPYRQDPGNAAPYQPDRRDPAPYQPDMPGASYQQGGMFYQPRQESPAAPRPAQEMTGWPPVIPQRDNAVTQTEHPQQYGYGSPGTGNVQEVLDGYMKQNVRRMQEVQAERTEQEKVAAVSKPVGWLVCIEGPDFGQSFPLREGKNSIGRSDEMDVVLKNDRAVSRRNHAWIEYREDGREFIASVGEAKKMVYVNDDLLLVPLTMGKNDVLALGDSSLMLIPCCDEAFSWKSVEREG